MSKPIINNYNISSPNLSDKYQIAFLGDIHSDVKKLEMIIDILKKLKVSALLLGGDTVDTNKDTRNSLIKELLQELAKTMDIFISIGNHDMVSYEYKSKYIRYEVKADELTFWHDLKAINEKNIHIPTLPIDKSTIDKWDYNDDITVSALNLPIEHYRGKESYEDFNELLKVMEELSINTNKFNILLCHSPINVVRNGMILDQLNYLKKFNLILSGHMHGGMVPNILRKRNYGPGLVGPYATRFPNHAYGIVKDDHTISLSTGGITKVSNSSEIGFISNTKVIKSIIDNIYPPELEIINLIPGEEKLEKVYKK